MKKLIINVSLATALFITNANAKNNEGKAIFETKGCVICHKPNMDTIGPSLRTIAISYTGKEGTMITFLQGDGTPIVDPSRASVMNPQLIKLRTLFDNEIKALAEYIISANDRPF